MRAFRSRLVSVACFSIAFSIWLICVFVIKVGFPVVSFVLAVMSFYVGEKSVVLWRLYLTTLLLFDPTFIALLNFGAFLMYACILYGCHLMFLALFMKFLKKHKWIVYGASEASLNSCL